MKRLTKKPWFGPKYFGWGWRPISWQGWLSTGIFIAVIMALARASEQSPWRLWILVPIILSFCLFCYLTGGPPGSIWFRDRESE